MFCGMVKGVNVKESVILGGYGNTLLGCARNAEQMLCRNATTSLEFPITLGRDFVGEVVECGAQVKDFKIGDKVWGVVPPYRNGSHAQFALVSACHVNFHNSGRSK
jgi:reticulon-4-interacting protein 1, mitochondrial